MISLSRKIRSHKHHHLPFLKVKENNDDAIDLDDVLLKIGEFGLYQKCLLWFVCLPACLPCGFCAFNQLFMTDTPDHWCQVPELQNMSQISRKMLSIPRKVYKLQTCP